MKTRNTDRGLRCEKDESNAKSATVYLYDVIGADLFNGISARAFIDAVNSVGEIDELHVRINSPGGDVFEGVAIYNFLAEHRARVITHVDGLAASMASFVMLAGARTEIAENAMVMVHHPWMFTFGDAAALRRDAEMLDRVWSSMLATYSRRTGRRGESMEQKIEKAGGEWWMTADEALAAGFVDEVVAPEQVAAVLALSMFERMPEHVAAAAQRVGPLTPGPRQEPAIAEGQKLDRATAIADAMSEGLLGRAARRRVVDAIEAS